MEEVNVINCFEIRENENFSRFIDGQGIKQNHKVQTIRYVVTIITNYYIRYQSFNKYRYMINLVSN